MNRIYNCIGKITFIYFILFLYLFLNIEPREKKATITTTQDIVRMKSISILIFDDFMKTHTYTFFYFIYKEYNKGYINQSIVGVWKPTNRSNQKKIKKKPN